MNRLFLIGLIMFATQAASARIQFAYPKTQPITVVITEWLYDGISGSAGIRLRDGRGNTRMHINSKGDYTYFNPSGHVRTDGLEMTEAEALELFTLAKNAHRCPLTLQFDRTTFQVVSATAGCDPFE